VTAVTLDTELRALLDKQAIREVMIRYCRGVDRFDAGLITSAYHPDAYDDHTGKIFHGATIGADIVEWLRPALKVVTHHITNQTISLGADGVTAGSESYYQGWHVEVRDKERIMHTAGRYLDRLEKRDGEWRISNRLVVIELARYVAPGEIEVATPAGLARKDRTDPSYAVLGS
jgi:SnoaL-like domain